MRTMIACMAVLLWVMGLISDAMAEEQNTPPPSEGKNLTLGFCQLIPNLTYLPVGREHELLPAPIASYELGLFDEHYNQMPKEQKKSALDLLESSAKVTVLQQPKNGLLTDIAKPAFSPPITGLFYNPTPGYFGKDQVIFLIEIGDYKIQLIFNIFVVDGSPENPDAIAEKCGKRGKYYKISTVAPKSHLAMTQYSLRQK